MKLGWTRSELTYCTNVHPGENLQQVYDVVSEPLNNVRKKRGLTVMSGGLWLSDSTSLDLSSSGNLSQFSDHLQQHKISLFTLNGFPTQGFHSKRVKQAVYHPDWSEPERLDYTLRLAHILAALLPQHISEGSISSVPLGFAPEWNQERNSKALDALCKCLSEFSKIKKITGRTIRLCLEMEPGCVLESTDELLVFFTDQLPRHLSLLGLDSNLINNHLGICFDVCHQAVMFEDCYESLLRIVDANIQIGKIQISSALELKSPTNDHACQSLAGFIEDKYLHQSRCIDNNNQLLKVMDLDQAVSDFPKTTPWRTHFHVPVQAETLLSDGLVTTQYEICRTLDFLKDHPQIHPHLEVETYTWTALPENIRPVNKDMMIEGLTTELQWLESQMKLRNLLQEDI